jgi:hypothetical protein
MKTAAHAAGGLMRPSWAKPSLAGPARRWRPDGLRYRVDTPARRPLIWERRNRGVWLSTLGPPPAVDAGLRRAHLSARSHETFDCCPRRTGPTLRLLIQWGTLRTVTRMSKADTARE